MPLVKLPDGSIADLPEVKASEKDEAIEKLIFDKRDTASTIRAEAQGLRDMADAKDAVANDLEAEATELEK